MGQQTGLRAKADITVLALGDCNTCGSNRLAPGRDMPSQLCALLRDARRGVVNMVNFGGTMSTSREGMSRMRREGMRTRADILLLNFGLVDAWVTTLPKLYIRYYPDNPLRKSARKLLKSIKRRLRAPTLRRLVPWGPVVPLQEYRDNMAAIITMVRTARPEASVVLWGTAPARNDAPRNVAIEDYDACLRQLAVYYSALFLETRALLDAAGPVSELYLDNVHLSERGNAVVAGAIFNLLQGVGYTD